MIPYIPRMMLIIGRKKACQYTPFDRFMYLVKSGTLVAMVAQPPVMELMLERINHSRYC